MTCKEHEETIRSLVLALAEITAYVQIRVTNPDRGVVGRTMLPRMIESLNLGRKALHGFRKDYRK